MLMKKLVDYVTLACASGILLWMEGILFTVEFLSSSSKLQYLQIIFIYILRLTCFLLLNYVCWFPDALFHEAVHCT